MANPVSPSSILALNLNKNNYEKTEVKVDKHFLASDNQGFGKLFLE